MSGRALDLTQRQVRALCEGAKKAGYAPIVQIGNAFVWPDVASLLTFRTWQQADPKVTAHAVAGQAEITDTVEVVLRSSPVATIAGNTARELARAEPYTEEEFRLAEEISVAVAEQRRDDDGKVTAYRLPADVAIIAARAALSSTREKPAARVPFAWARKDPNDPEGPLLFSEPWFETKDGEPTRSVAPPGDGWFPLYKED